MINDALAGTTPQPCTACDVELLPCLCGGTNFDAFTELEPAANGIVRCRSCNLQMPRFSLSEAAEAWNGRMAAVKYLRGLCGEAHQAFGAAGAPGRILDAMSDAAAGNPPRRLESMLPVSPDEFVSMVACTACAEKDAAIVLALQAESDLGAKLTALHMEDSRKYRELLAEKQGEIDRLREALNTPELHDFTSGVVSEAQHQRERWGSDHDAGKQPEDWFWLLGYLGGKCLAAQKAGDHDKALHHTISAAAVLANWHASMLGKTNMRPGIDPVERGIETASGSPADPTVKESLTVQTPAPVESAQAEPLSQFGSDEATGCADDGLSRGMVDAIRKHLEPKCSDCPPVGYPTDRTRCAECPNCAAPGTAEKEGKS